MRQRQQPKFCLILTEAIQEGLSSISPSISSVVFFHLKKNATIRSDNFVDDPQAFEEGLKKIFGLGAKVIEKKILEILYSKLEIPRKIENNFSFVDEVKNAERLLDCPNDLTVTKTT